ncbi:MAG TPA: AMP-binding protein [Streptosporangiaceae bacterium]|nr:AMP-binding protein [Streptosporangiaceae bacterium]
MTRRPLHALLLPPECAGRMLDALAAALDGTGPAVLPLDPALPRARLDALLGQFAPTAFETPEGTQCRTAGTGEDAGVPADVAVVVATSGSTGEPKGVQLSAAALRHSASASLRRIGATPGQRWLCPLPTSHIAGIGVLVRSLVSGTTPVVTGRLDPGERNLSQLGCANVSLVPTQLRRLLAAKADLDTFATILLGGAAAPASLLAQAHAAGARVVTTYGMTETCGGCVYNGHPLDGVSVRTGDDGHIQIAGPVLFSGYHRTASQPSVLDGTWFTTSDLGSVDGTGQLTVLGRADEMIITGGEKVAPAAVVAALESSPMVREAAVIGEPDPEWGQRVTAVIVPADPAAPPSLADLRAYVRRHLPPAAAPRALIAVPAIPLLPSGKPDLVELHKLGQSTLT